MMRMTRHQIAQSRIVMAEVDRLLARCNVWVERKDTMTEKPDFPTADLCQAKAIADSRPANDA